MMRHLVALAVVAWVAASSCSARVSHELLREDVQLKALRDASGKGLVGEVGSMMEGVVADASDTIGNTPLVLAVVGNKEATASAQSGKVAGVRAKYLKGNSAWWLAAGSDAGDIPDLLVQDRGDASAQNNEGRVPTNAVHYTGVSPILKASERRFYDAVKSLSSLNTNAKLEGTDLSGTPQSRLPLDVVSLVQKLQAANIVLSYNEEMNEGEIWDGSAPIHMTGKGCESGVLVWLLNNEATPASKRTNSKLPGDVVCEDMAGVFTDILDSQRRRIREVSLTIPGMRDLKGTTGSDETLSSGTPDVSAGNEATEISPTPSSTSQAASVDGVGESEDLGLQSTLSTPEDGCFFDDCTSEPTTTLRPKIGLSASENPNDGDVDTQEDNPPSDDGCFFDDCSGEASVSGETPVASSDDGCFFDDCSGEGSDSGESPIARSDDGCFFDDCSGEDSDSGETPNTHSEEGCFFDNCAPESGTPTPTTGLAPGKDSAKEVSGTHVACLSPPCDPDESKTTASNADVLTVDPEDLIHSPPASSRWVVVVIVACMVGFIILGVIIYLFGVRKLAAMPSEEELVARLDAGNWPDSNGVVKADVEVVSNLPKELGRSEMLRLASTPLAILPEDPPSEENGRHPCPVPPLHIQDMKLQRKKAGKSEKERDGRPPGGMVVENPRQTGGGAPGGKRVVFAEVTSTGNSVIDPPSGSVDLNSRQALMALYNDNHYGDAGRIGDLNYEIYTEDSLGSLDPYDPLSEGHNHLGGRSRNCKSLDHLTKSENPLYKESNQYTQTYVDSLTGRSDESRDYHNERRISLTGSF